MEELKELPAGLYQLVTWPDTRLKEVSVDCVEADIDELKKMIKPMLSIMKAFNGIGLAAVQIAVHKRFCLLVTNSNDLVELINPVIIESGEDKAFIPEGCLSLPSFNEQIERHNEVTVKYRDLEWVERTAVFSGREAQCIQHEIDHMNGITQNTKLSLMKAAMWEKKLKKGRKHGKIRI